MGCFVKGMVRFGVLAALAGGTAAVVAEAARPGSVSAILHQSCGMVGRVIDNNIDDPIALRAQIADLEAEYPKKIADVRSDLSEVREQISQLERERGVSEKVVQLTAADLNLIETGITRAKSVSDANQGAIVRIAFNEEHLSASAALAKRSQISQTKSVYQGRVKEIDTELGYLGEQESQLADLLNRLENEHAEFQAQLYQLDAQIDSIDRNNRLIAMMEDRQKTIDEHSRYQAHSLQQLQDRLAKIRGQQQSRLAAAAEVHRKQDYVSQAEMLVDQDEQVRLLVDPEGAGQIKWHDDPDVIEVDPSKPAPGDQVVSNN
ncbi:MAG: hypothetical protein H6810_05625 [Phycisphaeraceae bacterium]|nr:MAG: hypothetical protein H6810_05625 [Phycisphaeraceae bacterium]